VDIAQHISFDDGVNQLTRDPKDSSTWDFQVLNTSKELEKTGRVKCVVDNVENINKSCRLSLLGRELKYYSTQR